MRRIFLLSIAMSLAMITAGCQNYSSYQLIVAQDAIKALWEIEGAIKTDITLQEYNTLFSKIQSKLSFSAATLPSGSKLKREIDLSQQEYAKLTNIWSNAVNSDASIEKSLSLAIAKTEEMRLQSESASKQLVLASQELATSSASSLSILGLSLDASNILAVIAIIVSFIASFFAAYTAYLKPPRLSLIVGDHVDCTYTNDRKFRLYPIVTILNEGARVGSVTKIEGKISTGGDDKGLQWVHFYEAKNIAQPGETFKTWKDFSSWAHPLIVLPRDSVSKGIVFQTSVPTDVGIENNDPKSYKNTEYVIELIASLAGRRKAKIRLSLKLFLSAAHAKELDEGCRPNVANVSKHLRLNWERL